MNRPLFVIQLAWAIWATIWIAAARWSAPTLKVSQRRNNRAHWIMTLAGFVALVTFAPAGRPHGPLMTPLYYPRGDFAWAMVAAMVAAIAFGCWARVALGPLWSGTVTRKQDHRIIQSGPYRFVRHPIYTALIAAAAATAAVKATPLAIAGFLLMTVGLTLKARLEERFLSAELGEQAYASYRARVPMLVPFAPRPDVDRTGSR